MRASARRLTLPLRWDTLTILINVCFQCGQYHADKLIDPAGPYAICPACGYRHPFHQLPLLVISGASGSGKSTICQRLTGQVQEAILLDSDILWRPEFDRPENGYRDFFETWLRLAKNIGQSGRPVALFGAGAGVPANLESCVERRYFTQIYYLALICAPESLEQRLQARPAWRGCSSAFVAEQVRFNDWFSQAGRAATPLVETLDTTGIPIDETARQVSTWIKRKTIQM